jgi:citrate lyase subunit beta / citryl-CoA lyase
MRLARLASLDARLLAVGVNGVLVDAAHVKMAQATLARAALIEARGGRG